MPSSTKTSVVLANNEIFFRNGLRNSLNKFKKIAVVGEASTASQLMQLVSDVSPEIILLDAYLDKCAITVQTITKQNPLISIIALCGNREERSIIQLMEIGISGYLLKCVSPKELFNAIEEVKKGNFYYSPGISSNILKMVSNKECNLIIKGQPIFTKNERQIIDCICQDKTSKQISDKLFLSCRTIDGYRRKILKKMGAKGSVGIVIYAIKNGLYHV